MMLGVLAAALAAATQEESLVAAGALRRMVRGRSLAAAPAVDPTCFTKHCAALLGECMLDRACRGTMLCEAKCPTDDHGRCGFDCEMKYNNKDKLLRKFMTCAAENHCLPTFPPDCGVGKAPNGTCQPAPCAHATPYCRDPAVPCSNATNADAVQNITSLDFFAGEWWTLNGVNPHYDYFYCQHERFIPAAGGGWANNVSYGIDAKGQVLWNLLTLELIAPGVVAQHYSFQPLSPQTEMWRVVSAPHPEWLFVMWCGHNPVTDYSGGFLLSRKRDIAELPTDLAAVFQRDLSARFGLDFASLHRMNNTGCV